MFDSKFNLVCGNTKSGKTDFLIQTSKILKECGYKLFFLGATFELDNFRELRYIFDNFNFFSSQEKNNLLIIEKISELISKKQINLLIVDDIDFLPKKQIELIYKLNCKKIVSCKSSNSPLFQNLEFDDYFIEFQTLTFNDNKYKMEELVKSFFRNQKLNFLLD